MFGSLIVFLKELFEFFFCKRQVDVNKILRNYPACKELSHTSNQSKLPWPIPQNSVESDHGNTSRIYFNNVVDEVTLMLYNVMLT